jgi:phosphoserine phosphatase
MTPIRMIAVALLALAGSLCPALAQEVLPSWKAGPARDAIVRFVEDVTREGGPGFVSPAERIAVFDNDGTLWAEQPAYFQLFFAIDRVKALAPQHPEWKDKQPFKAALEGDMAALAASGEHGLLDLVMATHAGMTPQDFQAVVTAWLEAARHPRLSRRFDTLVYQPMLEVLAYLRANGFKTFIVSGGGIEFVRNFSERVYGIPPEQVVGSSINTVFEIRDGKAVLVRQPTVAFIDDKAGKPVGIQAHIGRRPIAAFGNSDGDFEMLQWTTEGPGRRLGVIVHHDDAEREFAYDRQSAMGRLSRALDEAPARGWTVVSMKDNWSTVFPAPR